VTVISAHGKNTGAIWRGRQSIDKAALYRQHLHYRLINQVGMPLG
jgi:hypothetical protein